MIKVMTSWGKKQNYRKRKEILIAKRWKYKEGLSTELHKVMSWYDGNVNSVF